MSAKISGGRAGDVGNESDIQIFSDLRNLLDNIKRTKLINARNAARLFMRIAQVLKIIKNLPITNILLPATLPGVKIAQHLRTRFLLMKTASAVCVVDLRAEGSWDVNIKGRGYHALRNNISRSNLLGHTCHPVDHEEFSVSIQTAILGRVPIDYLDCLSSEQIHEGMEHWVGKDKDGKIIALCRLVVAGNISHVKYICVTQENANSVIRWKINYEIIKNLYYRNVVMIIYDTVLKNTTGNIYFLKRLGAEVKKIVPTVQTHNR